MPVAKLQHRVINHEYGEVRIPIVQKMPFFEDLELDGGYRYSGALP